MSQPHGEITHVSDTALMVAACRALESECADGFVHDPFAARLAGERVRAMLQSQPHPEMMRFGIGVRTHFMDELLLETLASEAIATVVSVGCGLDTRPWRLELPPELRWIEVDFADMLDYKDYDVRRETAMRPGAYHGGRERRCPTTHDLLDRRWLAGAHDHGRIAHVLPAATVEALAAEPWHASGIAHWMTDVMTTAFAKAINMDRQSLRNVQAADFLQGEEILEHVYRQGWLTTARRSYVTDMAFAMERAQRLMGDRPRPAGPPPIAPNDPTGVHLFARAKS